MIKGWFDRFKKRPEEQQESETQEQQAVQDVDIQPPQADVPDCVDQPVSAQHIPVGEDRPEQTDMAVVHDAPEQEETPVGPDTPIQGATPAESDTLTQGATPAEPDTVPQESTQQEDAARQAGPPEPDAPHRKGFFARLRDGLSKTRTAITGRVDEVLSGFRSIDEELFEGLEEALIMADIGVDTTLYMIEQLRTRAKQQALKEASQLKAVLRDIIREILTQQDCEMHLGEKPAVVMVIGVNGVGKTTSIGKLAYQYKSAGKKVLLAAGDTFRAAAIDQLQIWADRAGVDIVKHQEGADPSAVVFDAIQAAKARGADIVICDTAGRLHNKKHLMEELKKTARVVERELGYPPAEVLLVLDATTGQNALVQAREFSNAAGITGVILTKLDGTAKGGVVIALSREQGIGVKFIGVGEGMDDMQPFDPAAFADALFPAEAE